MDRPIDHLVICVRDLERASAFYERLGFTLTPRAQHPFGTANRLAQFKGNFLELLAVADAARIPLSRSGHFSFGAFNAHYLERLQGMSMLVFASSDARRDHAEFASRSLDTYAPFDFSRAARLPDGREVTVAFSLAFVTHAEILMPRSSSASNMRRSTSGSRNIKNMRMALTPSGASSWQRIGPRSLRNSLRGSPSLLP